MNWRCNYLFEWLSKKFDKKIVEKNRVRMKVWLFSCFHVILSAVWNRNIQTSYAPLAIVIQILF